jgi:hypothetical protein
MRWLAAVADARDTSLARSLATGVQSMVTCSTWSRDETHIYSGGFDGSNLVVWKVSVGLFWTCLGALLRRRADSAGVVLLVNLPLACPTDLPTCNAAHRRAGSRG